MPSSSSDKHGNGFTASKTTTGSLKLEKTMKTAIEAALQKAHASNLADVKVDATGLTIGLVGSSAYFDGNDASLRPAAVTVLNAVAPYRQRRPDHHCRGPRRPARLAGPLRQRLEPRGRPRRQRAALPRRPRRRGPADLVRLLRLAQPIAGEGQATVEKNRRVDIVVHTAAAEAAPTGTATPAASASPAP